MTIILHRKLIDCLKETSDTLSTANPAFRVISTSSKSIPLRDWLSDEHGNMFFTIPTQPMDEPEEARILSATNCPSSIIGALLTFANKYRASVSAESVQKSRKLGTRSLVRIAKRVAAFPWDDDIHAMLSRAVLADFLPPTERTTLQLMLEESGIRRRMAMHNPAPDCQRRWTPVLPPKLATSLTERSPYSFRNLTRCRILRAWLRTSLIWTISLIIACRRGSCGIWRWT